MKKIVLLLALTSVSVANAQFKVSVEAPANFAPKEVYLYTLNGSRDVLSNKEIKKGNTWQINVSKPYTGMMKLYFPETNASLNFISENKDVKLKLVTNQEKIVDVDYLDEANKTMNQVQDVQQKKELILPALYQIKEYYRDSAPFGAALMQEINRLSVPAANVGNHPFVQFYTTNYARFVEKKADKSPVTHQEIIDFVNKSTELLETSSLLRPVLVSYLNIGPNTNLTADVDKLLAAVNTETPRGQTVLSELIEIFDTYGMSELKDQYLSLAKNLKCTINERLSQTIASNQNTEIGAVFPNYTFTNVSGTKAKTVHDVKANRKVLVFWASTCSHCENDLPILLQNYNKIKSIGGEVIGLSLDSDRVAYQNKVKMLPWINDSELKGWNSSYSDTYNVRATPTYFVLDGDNKIIAKPNRAADVISFLKLK